MIPSAAARLAGRMAAACLRWLAPSFCSLRPTWPLAGSPGCGAPPPPVDRACSTLRAEDGVDPAARGSAGAARSGAAERRCRCPAQGRKRRAVAAAAAAARSAVAPGRRRSAHPASRRAGDRPRGAARRRSRRWRALLTDAEPEVRQMAAFALGLIGDRAAIDRAAHGARRRLAARAGPRGRSAGPHRRRPSGRRMSARWCRPAGDRQRRRRSSRRTRTAIRSTRRSRRSGSGSTRSRA